MYTNVELVQLLQHVGWSNQHFKPALLYFHRMLEVINQTYYERSLPPLVAVAAPDIVFYIACQLGSSIPGFGLLTVLCYPNIQIDIKLEFIVYVQSMICMQCMHRSPKTC